MNAAPAFIICEKCGYSTNEPVGEDGITSKVGRCCENLPAPYEYNSSAGLYSLTYEERYGRSRPRTFAPSPDEVDDVLGLSDDVYEELQSLWTDAPAEEYDRRCRELGWTP